MSLVITQDNQYVFVVSHAAEYVNSAYRKKAEETGFCKPFCLLLFSSDWAWIEKRVPEDTVCMSTRNKTKNVWQQKWKKDLLWIIEQNITAGRLLIAAAVKASMTPFS